MRGLRWSILALLLAAPLAQAAPATLKGSPASMERQHRVAKKAGYDFAGSHEELHEMVEERVLVPLDGNAHYSFKKGEPQGYALPEVKLFVERLAEQYFEATGEQLVVTSASRPKSNKLWNSHALSVHPVGMAIDLRVSRDKASRIWLESTLLSLERKGVLDVTRERRPPHYHIAVFPDRYTAYLEKMIGPEALAAALAPPEPVVEVLAEVVEPEPLRVEATVVQAATLAETLAQAELSPTPDLAVPAPAEDDWMYLLAFPAVVFAVGVSILFG